jgi:cytochrome c
LINGNKVGSTPQLSYSFADNGIYKAVLKVSDQSGNSGTDTVEIKVGNTLPEVKIAAIDNSTFYFNKPTAFNYTVNVSDKEDKVIDKKAIKVSMNYTARVASNQAVVGHQQIDANYNFGKALVANSDCKACHQLNAKSVGPAFMLVSQKYAGDKTAISRLANKIITGGGGVWGDHAMNAHPQLSREDATEIVKYVLSLSTQKGTANLPPTGKVLLKEHMDDGEERGRYFITASYTDKGGAITPLSNKDVLVLRPSKVQAEDVDEVGNIQKQQQGVNINGNNSYLVLRDIDLKDIQGVTYRYASANRGATISLRIDSLKGQEISAVNYEPTGARDKFAELSAPLNNPGGKHHLYFVFVKTDTPNTRLGSLDWLRFDGGKEVKVAAPKKETVQSQVAETTKSTPVKTTTAGKGSTLITKSDCLTCHKQAERLVGPSFNEIAKRYKPDAATKNKLATKIIKGGAGAWGQIPMTPHPQLSKTDAIEIVDFILKKK